MTYVNEFHLSESIHQIMMLLSFIFAYIILYRSIKSVIVMSSMLGLHLPQAPWRAIGHGCSGR